MLRLSGLPRRKQAGHQRFSSPRPRDHDGLNARTIRYCASEQQARQRTLRADSPGRQVRSIYCAMGRPSVAPKRKRARLAAQHDALRKSRQSLFGERDQFIAESGLAFAIGP